MIRLSVPECPFSTRGRWRYPVTRRRRQGFMVTLRPKRLIDASAAATISDGSASDKHCRLLHHVCVARSCLSGGMEDVWFVA